MSTKLFLKRCKPRFNISKNMRILPVVSFCFVCSLPMASFAYAGEWDELISGANNQNIDSRGSQNNVQPSSRLQQVKRLDQEIMILRAEMSKKNGAVKQVRQYLRQLDKQFVLPDFKRRVERLHEYVDSIPEQKSSFFSFFSHSKTIDFPMHDKNAVVAIVLPVSGPYGFAGESIQKSLQIGLKQAGFTGKLIAIDLANYDSVFEAWEILKYYDPQFIFGPLQKDKISQWQALKTGVPTLYFNEITAYTQYEFSLSPSKQAGLEQVFQILNQSFYQRILVLKEPEETSQELEQAFDQAWSNTPQAKEYITQNVEKTVGQAIDNGLNINKSNDRKSWLQSVLHVPLKFTPRPRQDIEAIVSFVPQNLAIQVAPYINFISNSKSIPQIWYPSKTPTAYYLLNNLDAWQDTFAILPASLAIDVSKNNSKNPSSNKNGLFYALGRVAIEIVKSEHQSSQVDTLIETAKGTYVRNANGQFYLLPDVYWADNGVFEKFVSNSAE